MKNLKIAFTILRDKYVVYRLEKDSQIPAWAMKSEFFSITKTYDELSVVCSQEDLHCDIKCERDWRKN